MMPTYITFVWTEQYLLCQYHSDDVITIVMMSLMVGRLDQ